MYELFKYWFKKTFPGTKVPTKQEFRDNASMYHDIIVSVIEELVGIGSYGYIANPFYGEKASAESIILERESLLIATLDRARNCLEDLGLDKDTINQLLNGELELHLPNASAETMETIRTCRARILFDAYISAVRISLV